MERNIDDESISWNKASDTSEINEVKWNKNNHRLKKKKTNEKKSLNMKMNSVNVLVKKCHSEDASFMLCICFHFEKKLRCDYFPNIVDSVE